jgi:hypothetical protein
LEYEVIEIIESVKEIVEKGCILNVEEEAEELLEESYKEIYPN